MPHSDSHEGDAIFELVADLDNLMLIHVKIASRIHVSAISLMTQMESASRFIKPSNVDAGSPFRDNLFPLIQDKVGKRFLASTVKRNSLDGAEVLQVGVNLATDRMLGGSDCFLDSTSLLD
jgi:hypothetical protein